MGQIAPWRKCLPCKPEDLSSNPRGHVGIAEFGGVFLYFQGKQRQALAFWELSLLSSSLEGRRLQEPWPRGIAASLLLHCPSWPQSFPM